MAEEAKKRQINLAGTRPNSLAKDLEENLPQGARAPQARDQAANLVGVSGRLIDMAEKVVNQGIPELAAAGERKEGDGLARWGKLGKSPLR